MIHLKKLEAYLKVVNEPVDAVPGNTADISFSSLLEDSKCTCRLMCSLHYLGQVNVTVDAVPGPTADMLPLFIYYCNQ